MVKFGIKADKTALLIIDMQNAFLAPGSPAERPLGRDLIPKLNQLIRACHEKGFWLYSPSTPSGRMGAIWDSIKTFLVPQR